MLFLGGSWLGNFGAASNLDNATNSGVYIVWGGTTGMPGGSDGGFLFVLNPENSSTFVMQIYLPQDNSLKPQIFYRQRWGSSSWGYWATNT